MTFFKIFLTLIVLFPITLHAQGGGGQRPPTPVIVIDVTESSFADEVEALGTLKANDSVDLASSVTELVTKIAFTDNQNVKQGDIIVEMDAAEELAELAEQQSILDEAQRQVDRLTPLVKRGAASQSNLDENRRDLMGAKARVDAIQSRVSQRIIKAPFDGVLGLKNISVGALAQPGTMITTIDDISKMKLDFSVPEVFLATLGKGVIVRATTDAFPDQIFDGVIESIDSRIDTITRSIKARAIIDNGTGILKPGLLMQVTLEKNPRQAIIIPEETLSTSGTESFIFVVKDSKVEKRMVELGQRQFGKIEILSGLNVGEQIITHGILRVRDGAAVTVKATEKNNEPIKELLSGDNQ